MSEWIRTADRRPAQKPGEQVDVIFGGHGWATAVRGMYTHFPDLSPAACWSEYDQQNDKFIDWGPVEPELWMLFPQLPDATE